MDSGNSGSMQSSSGGDEEYDSRADSMSALLITNPPSRVGPMGNPPQHHQTHHMFDPLSHLFDPLSSSSRQLLPLANPNSFLNLDMAWSKSLQSDPNSIDLGVGVGVSGGQPFLTNNNQLGQTRVGGGGGGIGGGTFPAMQIPQETMSSGGSVPVGSTAPNVDPNMNSNNTNNNNMGVRNPKKRSRASRRAPTTVLTTDTTNFRAMVQEFTGIPAPPFTSSPFPRTRLDLFGSSGPSFRSGPLDPSPSPYLLRPFAHKVQPPPPPFVPPSSSASSSSSTVVVEGIVSNSTTSNSSSTSPNNINYQLSSELGLLKQPHHHQNLLNNMGMQQMQNPLLNFQPLLQTQPKYPLSSTSTSINLGSKPQGGLSMEIPATDHSHLKMGVLEEFGLTHGGGNVNNSSSQLSGFHILLSSSSNGALSSRNENNPTTTTTNTNWVGDGVGSTNNNNNNSNNNADQGLLRSINGSYSSTTNPERQVTNGKLNFSAPSSSDFHGDKGTENVTTARNEGMVESWICSSD
ncbi:hypothetical protein FNV43_RR19334 [Rhamnella rubrinervis]|uniref:VQ domain-containing protein n=1 Tax=Rhamnella rubrinervis TaxID=2594499 RepID=A0A8K0E6V8_9ROSA|nr:hypothetical protein FNV43_RR19334 [Rhamnella rubrinervis]